VRYPPHPLTKSEARRIVQTSADGTRVGLRNRAHITVLYRTGARCSESCALDVSDVYPLDDGCAMIRINRPKGYARGVMPREVGIDPLSAAYIFEWMSERGPEQGPLFITESGQRVLPSYMRQILPRLGDRLCIERRIHPHAFRHTFARELYDEGVGIMEIMLALGHTSLGTTQNYLRSIGATEVVHTTSRRKW
jgi:site-specific recombinase XerD